MPGMAHVVDHFSLSQCYAGKIWKRVKRFPPTLSRRNLKKKKNNHRSIWIRFWEKLGQENHMVLLCELKCFPPTQKRKDGIFKFLMFQERFRKAPFSRSWRIRTEGSPNRRSKALFSNFSGKVSDGVLATKSITQQFRSLMNECVATLSHLDLS